MQQIVVDQPYQFIPPHKSRFWIWFFSNFLPGYMRRKHGLVKIETRGMERLQASLKAGHGILIAPNHSRPSDPMLMGWLFRATGQPVHVLASWHLFMHSRMQCWLIRRLGGFSVYREGVDRAALSTSIDILAQRQRPLVVFPEGAVTRTNDLLGELQEGTAFLARSAAKRRAKESPPGKVVVHPLAVKYYFQGDIHQAADGVLTDIESRLSWQPQRQLPLVERIYKLASALLAIKEVEYLGEPQFGPLFERRARLIEHILQPLERKWLPAAADNGSEGSAVMRVKALRSALVANLVGGKLSSEEKARRWRQIHDIYLAQNLSLYPTDYLRSRPTPERVLETVERFEEDLTDVARPHPPMHAVLSMGEAIEVDAQRPRGGDDPLMGQIKQSLQGMLDELEQGSGPLLPLPEWMQVGDPVAAI